MNGRGNGKSRDGTVRNRWAADGAQQLLELAGRIFDAAVDPTGWPDVLNQIADTTGATVASLGTANCVTGEFGIVAPRHDPDYLRRYVEEGWATRNLHWQRSGPTPVGEVFAAETFVPRDEFVRTDFYHEWAAPQGLENALGVNVLVEGAYSTVLSTCRSFSHGSFDGEETRLFATLVPHIQRSVQLQLRLSALEMQRASSAAVFDRLRDGVVIVDRGSGIMFANRTAEELLASGDGVVRDRDGLAAATPGATATLRRLIAGRGNGDGLPDAGGRCLLPRGNGRAPLSVLAVPVHGEVAWIVPHRPAAVLFITDPERDNRASSDAQRRRFNLTRAEAAFLAEIVKGDGLQAAAGRLGVSLATARTHLRHVFEKTGTQRQAELVGLAALRLTALREDV
ncbi:MAG TPA: helix-turn-helix transcriptional regulator [Acetobacteraceae bacterium]|nr:helix-turn-helix transcriptional regulator [Acetobacteraceae bacterium]